jgi:aarF domain-containing kinase
VLAQKLLVDEMVAAVNALTREALGEALKLVLASNSAVTALRNIEALGPLRTVVLPMPLPLHIISTVNSQATLTPEDRRALDTLSLILDMIGMTPASKSKQGGQDLLTMVEDFNKTLRTGETIVRGAGELAPIVPELLPGLQYTIEMFLSKLMRRMALRLADDLDMLD